MVLQAQNKCNERKTHKHDYSGVEKERKNRASGT